MSNPHPRSLPAAVHADDRSALGRASDGRPFRPYVYKGGDIEPPEVIAARERHQAINDRIDAARAALYAGDGGEAMPDIGPGYEWNREMGDE